jgi:hypothetical protein
VSWPLKSNARRFFVPDEPVMARGPADQAEQQASDGAAPTARKRETPVGGFSIPEVLKGAVAGAAAGVLLGMTPQPSVLYGTLVASPAGNGMGWFRQIAFIALVCATIGSMVASSTGTLGGLVGGLTSIVVGTARFPYRFVLAFPIAAVVAGISFGLSFPIVKSERQPIYSPIDSAFILAGAALAGGLPAFQDFRRRRVVR